MDEIQGKLCTDNKQSHRVDLLERYGELMPSRALQELLHFNGDRSFRRAAAKQALPITVFRVLGRPGWFARTRDVCKWLESAVDGRSPHIPSSRRKESKS